MPFPWQAGELIETDTSQIRSSWLFHLLVAPWKTFSVQDELWLSASIGAAPQGALSDPGVGGSPSLTLLPSCSPCQNQLNPTTTTIYPLHFRTLRTP